MCDTAAGRSGIEDAGRRLIPVVVDLEPITIGILHVELLYAVRANLEVLAVARPVAILDILFVKHFSKFFERRHAEREMIIASVLLFLGVSLDEVELTMIADAEPDVLLVLERFVDLFQADHIFIEICTGVQIVHKHGEMIDRCAATGCFLFSEAGECHYEEAANE